MPKIDEELLVSLPRAAKMLDVCERTIRRHFKVVRVGNAARVRLADIKAKARLEEARDDLAA